MSIIEQYVKELYPDNQQETLDKINELTTNWSKKNFPTFNDVNHSDVLMISYGDSFNKEGVAPLGALKSFMDSEFKDTISAIHILPMFPFSSDDGFSVIDFKKINPDLGGWKEIEDLNNGYDLMFDAVINHVSQHSDYFKGYLSGDEKYANYFIEKKDGLDYKNVVRPRALPLFTEFETSRGKKQIWTTFSDDQVDLNFQCPDVLITILDILFMFAFYGSRFIRFDAIGFAWKEDNSSCMSLPQTHTLVKLIRAVLEVCVPGVTIITETNVPHEENISYFGNGHDEAALVYQFPLPPLVVHTFLRGDSSALTNWAQSLEATTEDTTFFNFLASHDGIGMRPLEGILSREDQKVIADEMLKRGGEIGYRTLPDGSEVPYELNINYLDAIAGNLTTPKQISQKFLASQFIMLSMIGMPAIYYHSLIGSRGHREGYETSGIKRRINREKLNVDTVIDELHTEGSLRNLVSTGYKQLIKARRNEPLFAPQSEQLVLSLSDAVFAIQRSDANSRLIAVVNVTDSEVDIVLPFSGTDIISNTAVDKNLTLNPWQYMWILSE